jgi:hypothetical protein
MGHIIELTVVSRNKPQLIIKVDAEAGRNSLEWGYAEIPKGFPAFCQGAVTSCTPDENTSIGTIRVPPKTPLDGEGDLGPEGHS